MLYLTHSGWHLEWTFNFPSAYFMFTEANIRIKVLFFSVTISLSWINFFAWNDFSTLWFYSTNKDTEVSHLKCFIHICLFLFIVSVAVVLTLQIKVRCWYVSQFHEDVGRYNSLYYPWPYTEMKSAIHLGCFIALYPLGGKLHGTQR